MKKKHKDIVGLCFLISGIISLTLTMWMPLGFSLGDFRLINVYFILVSIGLSCILIWGFLWELYGKKRKKGGIKHDVSKM